MATVRELEIRIEQTGNAVSGLGSVAGGVGGLSAAVGSVLGPLGLAAGAIAAMGAAALAAATGGIAVLTLGLSKITSGLLGMGADAEDVLSKFDVVFGEFSNEAKEAFDGISEATGRSRFELYKYGAEIQDILVPMGMGRDQAKDMSIKMSALAADLSSFNNVPFTQAMQDIQSILVGNTEVAKKYGVVINADKIKQEAMRIGAVKFTQDTEALAKAQDKLVTKTEDLYFAQADADLAQRRFNDAVNKYGGGSTQAASASVALEKAQRRIRDIQGDITDTTNDVNGGFMEQSTVIDDTTKAMATMNLLLAGTQDAQGDSAATSDSWNNSLTTMSSIIKDVKTEMGLLLIDAFSPYMAAVREFVQNVAPQFQSVFQTWVETEIPKVITSIQSLLEAFGLMDENSPKLDTIAVDLFSSALYGLSGAITSGINNVISFKTKVEEFLNTDWVAVLISWKEAFVQWLIDLYAEGPAKLAQFTAAIGETLKNGAPKIAESVAGWVTSALQWLNDAIAQIPAVAAGLVTAFLVWVNDPKTQQGFSDAASGITKAIIDFATTNFGTVETVAVIIETLVQTLGVVILGALAGLITLGGQIVAGIISGILASLGIDLQPTTVSALSGVLWNIGTDLWTIAKTLGGRIITGIKTGIKSNVSKITEAAVQAAKDAFNAAKSWLGIHSPSKKFAEIGKYSMEGFAKGIDTYSKIAKSSVSNALDFNGRTALAGVGASSGGGNVTVQLNYSPVISTADEFELERILTDVVKKINRK